MVKLANKCDLVLNVRNILNKLLWNPKENIANYEIAFIHRGAPMDIKNIPCNLILKVKISWFTYKSAKEGEVIIPFHRVLKIRNVRTGRIVWKKRTRS